MKKEKGITLIALIITIIILIILAVVSVQTIKNLNITKYAENAAGDYNVEQEKELIGVAYADYSLEKYLPEGIGKTLNVEGAKITEENETEWTVEFEKTGNIYYVQKKDGTVIEFSMAWWKLTEEEERAIDDAAVDSETWVIAVKETSEGVTVGVAFMVITEGNGTKDVLMIVDETSGVYLFPVNDNASEQERTSGLKKKYQWYFSTDGSRYTDETVEEYNGPCPISIEDFQGEDSAIVSESYLERVINSFNN